MESPEPTSKTTTAVSDSSTSSAVAATAITTVTTSTSSPVQESPFSSFLSNLSPIPVKAPHVLQGFLGFNSPPLVFTSPHINAIRETSSLKRPLSHQLAIAEMSRNVDGGRKFADGPGDLEKSDSLLDSGLVADTHKIGHVKNLVQVQPNSSLGCVDEYLADPADIDCANSTCAANPNLKRPNNLVQSSPSGITDSKKTMPKFDNNELKMKVDVPVAISGEAEQNFQGKLRFDVKQIRSKGEETCGALPSNQYLNTKSNLSVDHASSKQQFQDAGAQHAGSVHEDESCCPPQLLPQPLQIIQTYEDSEENAGALPHGLDSSMHDLEASQHLRGLSRRCLQFEEAQPKATVSQTNPSNQENNVTSSRSPATTAESLDSSYVEINATSSKRQLVNLSQPMISPHDTGKSSLTVSKPSGIGLHLNSIVNALPKGHAATLGIKLASSEYGMLESKASIAVSSMIPKSLDNTGPLNMLPPTAHHATPLTKRRFNSEHADSFEEFSQMSPKKKRKKSSSTVDGDGCKRCNCKKSKCLKLYCDCFAAGIYCAESCACQGCFNRPEYEDTVLETRQQIESRDPLAFAPKVVQHANKFPVNHGDDGKRLTPSSARHKRGCNCKKSMCLKKYCECYQANVGCSGGCRCEGCKNVYGRKEEYVAKEEILSNRTSKERSEGTFDDKLEMVTNKKGFLHAELYDPYNLTPGILSRRYVPSPESSLTILSSYAKTPRSQKNSDSNDMLLETSKEILDIGCCGQNADYSSSDMMDQFSSRRDALADLCHLTPLLDYPSMASSASPKATDRTNVSKLQLCPRSGGFSSGGSLRWRSSPVTPMTQLRGTKSHQAPDSDSGLCDFLEDDTPEILKDASTTPIKAVKVSSPSRKRVSPPHTHLHELGSSSSGILKSGRKFILKAVPSFPPLTPCIDSKRSTDQSGSDFQENKE